MDQPVRGESVSEGVSMERKEDSGSLWHRLHLHSLAGSRWTDVRIDRQRGDGETHKHTDTRRHCCTASSSHSAAAKRKEEQDGGDARR